MERYVRGTRIGYVGLALLIASWLAIYLAPRLAASNVVPHVWEAVLIGGLPSAFVLGIIAGRMASKWWFVVSAIGFLTITVMLVGIAV